MPANEKLHAAPYKSALALAIIACSMSITMAATAGQNGVADNLKSIVGPTVAAHLEKIPPADVAAFQALLGNPAVSAQFKESPEQSVHAGLLALDPGNAFDQKALGILLGQIPGGKLVPGQPDVKFQVMRARDSAEPAARGLLESYVPFIALDSGARVHIPRVLKTLMIFGGFTEQGAYHLSRLGGIVFNGATDATAMPTGTNPMPQPAAAPMPPVQRQNAAINILGKLGVQGALTNPNKSELVIAPVVDGDPQAGSHMREILRAAGDYYHHRLTLPQEGEVAVVRGEGMLKHKGNFQHVMFARPASGAGAHTIIYTALQRAAGLGLKSAVMFFTPGSDLEGDAQATARELNRARNELQLLFQLTVIADGQGPVAALRKAWEDETSQSAGDTALFVKKP